MINKMFRGTLLCLMMAACNAIPKKYEANGGFLPSYYQQSGDQLALESNEPDNSTRRRSDDVDVVPGDDQQVLSLEGRQKEPKFGLVTLGATGLQGGYQTGSGGGLYPSVNGPLKLDLGGVVLGAIIGLGAFFVLPKLLHVFNQHGGSGYEGFKRSEGEAQTSLMDILARVDDTLSQYNIDSSSCMQRAVCSYVKSAATKVTEGLATSVDTVIDGAANNAVLGFMLDGTSIKQAVEMGRKGGNCAATFAKCPFTKETVFTALKTLVAESNKTS